MLLILFLAGGLAALAVCALAVQAADHL